MSDPVVRAYESHDSGSGTVTNESESGEVQDVSRHYVVGQLASFNAVVAWVTENLAPRYVQSDGSGKYWVRRRLRCAGIGNGYWDVTADYQTLVPKDGGEEGGDDPQAVPGSIAWDTTGRSERRYQALEETNYPDGAPSFDGAINVNGTSVEGIDVPVPGMRYTETWILPASLAMSDDFMNAVFRSTGSCNVSKFRIFESGEALFMGARTQWQSDQPYATVAFEWEGRPNIADFYPSIGFGDSFPKEGWEYVWCTYADEVAADTLVRRPKSAHKNRLFPKLDWDGLVVAVLDAPGRPIEPVAPGAGFGGGAVPAFGGG
jgi:hypothetical protein